MQTKFLILFIRLCAGITAPVLAEDQLMMVPENIHKGEFMVSESMRYFYTNANYNSTGGSYTPLANGGVYNNLRSDTVVRYDWSSKWSTSAGLGAARATSNNGTIYLTNSSVTDIYAGLQYNWQETQWHLIPNFWAGYPFTRISDATTSVINNEGAVFLQAGLWAMYEYGHFEPYGYIGLRYQDQQRADLLPFHIGLRYQLQYIWLGAEIDGEVTMVGDKNNGADKNNVTTNLDAGSMAYYSMNPYLYEAKGYGEGWLTQDIHLRLGAAQTINGKNTAAGWTAFAVVSLDVSSIPHTHSKIDEMQTHPAMRFRVDDKNYDDTYFKGSVEVPDTAPAPVRSRKSNVDQMLDDTQKSLEPHQ